MPFGEELEISCGPQLDMHELGPWLVYMDIMHAGGVR